VLNSFYPSFFARYYDKFKIPEILYFRAISFCTFVVICFVGPASLSWAFGIGGSIAAAHACLRNSQSHKNDDDEPSNNDDENSLLLESGGSKDQPFVSCDDGGGEVLDIESMDSNEVVSLVWSRLKAWSSADGKRALSTFRLMDKDGSGTLDFEEFKEALSNTGVVDGISDEILHQVITSADSNNDGVIQYSEFLHKIKAYSV
jgi:hypothetical protein